MEKPDAVFSAVAAYFAMLAEPTRLRIMQAICERERSVNQIVGATGVAQSNVSRHLALMHRHGVLERRRDGNQIYYRVADATMLELCHLVSARIARTMDEQRPLQRRLLKFVPAGRKRAAGPRPRLAPHAKPHIQRLRS